MSTNCLALKKKSILFSTNLVPKNVISFPLNLLSPVPNSDPRIYFRNIALKNYPKSRGGMCMYKAILSYVILKNSKKNKYVRTA